MEGARAEPDRATSAEGSSSPILESRWMLAARGLIALAFGVLAALWPDMTLLALVALFAAYALLTGVVSVFGAVKNRSSDKRWWIFLILGLVSIGAGVISVIHPALTALVLVLVMGANALVTGILDLVIAVQMRKRLPHLWLLVLAGLASVVFGVLVFLFPGAGALALVWLIAAHAIVIGALFIALTVRAGRPAQRLQAQGG
jgi:uncharacterized membrane protein HdeD (DUF308 family)